MRNDNRGVNFQVKGIWAIAAIVLVFLYFGYYNYSMESSLNSPQAQQDMKVWIAGHYGSQQAEWIIEKHEMGEEISEEERFVATTDDITFKSIKVRGLFSEYKMVRAEPLIAGEPPDDGRQYWYFRTKYSLLFGWSSFMESNETVWSMGWL